MEQEVYKLHGNVDQKERSDTYFKFKENNTGAVLFSTDVASRGLDFYYVNNTILLDLPDSVTEYAHRIGRAARIDNRGTSLLVL